MTKKSESIKANSGLKTKASLKKLISQTTNQNDKENKKQRKTDNCQSGNKGYSYRNRKIFLNQTDYDGQTCYYI